MKFQKQTNKQKTNKKQKQKQNKTKQIHYAHTGLTWSMWSYIMD